MAQIPALFRKRCTAEKQGNSKDEVTVLAYPKRLWPKKVFQWVLRMFKIVYLQDGFSDTGGPSQA